MDGGKAQDKPHDDGVGEGGCCDLILRSQPPWVMPALYDSPLQFWDKFYPLRVLNSLTRKKERFVTMSGIRVLWYMCGPTVYDASHMGHARTYVQFDTLRRIMTDIFGYDVVMCMNITDIDDKIIVRAAESGVHFRDLAAKNEADFMNDMKMLSVLPPHVLTRVSEYVPEVVEYIQGIIDRGYAYESNGSVYFDVNKYDGDSGHVYGKLRPESIGNAELLAEGEGALSAGCGKTDKRDRRDFALWKKSKDHEPGKPPEPSWESPWGMGRPGWHIECSVMASHTFQELSNGLMDVHTGGVDLEFPHHDNEIAQAEARLGCKQWVNYFLHAGHLHIKGLKMSKSLKNFITIKEALQFHTARQIRFCFLLSRYNQGMDYGDATMSNAVAVEKIFSEFFHNVKAALRSAGVSKTQHMGDAEKALFLKLQETKQEVRRQLADDFNIPNALSALQSLVKDTNKYLDCSSTASLLIRSVAEYVTTIFRAFGLVSGGSDSIGFGSTPGEDNGAAVNKEEVVAPILDALAAYRTRVRAAAREGDAAAVLRMSDELRDEILPLLGVRLEDKDDGPIWKLEDPDVLSKEKEQKEAEAARKAQAKAEQQKKEADKAAKARIPPTDMFKLAIEEDGVTPKYKQFDEDGVPSHDSQGEPLGKSQLKKLRKESEAQKKLYEKYMARADGQPQPQP